MTVTTHINAIVVDDSEDDRYLAQRALRQIGVIHNVKEIASGADLLDLLGDSEAFAQISGAIPPKTLILLDIRMPGMDGLGALAAMQSMAEAGQFDAAANSIVVMLTSSDHPDDRITSMTYDFVHAYLEKPLSRAALDSLLRQHF